MNEGLEYVFIQMSPLFLEIFKTMEGLYKNLKSIDFKRFVLL